MKKINLREMNRKINISIWVAFLILLIIISIISLVIYLQRNKVYYVHYDETSDVNYTVKLKENDYFNDENIEKSNQFIASLINEIEANFKYVLNVKDDIDYNYKYKIIATTKVIDDDSKRTIYEDTEELLNTVTGTIKGVLDVNENIKIDYSKYNNQINNFIKTYKLTNVKSQVNVNLLVGIDGDKDNLSKTDESIVSLEVPLNTSTVAVNKNCDLANNVDSLITLKKDYKKSDAWLKLSIFILIVDIGLGVGCVIYIKKTETEEEKYTAQLRKIKNNYGTFISKIEEEFDMQDYKILRVEKFVDLLEIRDTTHNPIIMVENKEQYVTCFLIPTDSKLLYFYSLGITHYALPTTKEEKRVTV